jgi:predicted nucleic acid-binding protein
MGGIMTSTSMTKSDIVFVDTSALYALFNESDMDHLSAITCMHELTQNQCSFIISNFIVDEIYTLLLTKVNRSVALKITEYLISEWVVERISYEDEQRAMSILKSSKDKSYSYTDSTSFALMERLGIKYAFAFDKHFQQYGLKVFFH